MVLPCQTFLLTLQDSNCLVDLFCSVDNLEVQNPNFLGPSWQEIQELNYKHREIYKKELQVLNHLTDYYDQKTKNFWQGAGNFWIKGRQKPEVKTVSLEQIKNLDLAKNLEIVGLFWQYEKTLKLFEKLDKIKESQNSSENLNYFFGQDLAVLFANFQVYIQQVLAKIKQNVDFKLKLDEKILQKLTLINFENGTYFESNLELNLQKKTENSKKEKLANQSKNSNWQVIFCPQELAGDLAIFAKNWKNYEKTFTHNSVGNKKNDEELSESEEMENERAVGEKYPEFNGQKKEIRQIENQNLDSENLENVFEKVKTEEKTGKIDLENINFKNTSFEQEGLANTVEKKAENESLKKDINQVLLDSNGFAIFLERQKFDLEKQLKHLGFEIKKAPSKEFSKKNQAENKPKFSLNQEQKEFLMNTLARVIVERRMNFYRFEVNQNLPVANYKKSQIMLSSQKNQEIEKKTQLSFLIVSFPNNQTQNFFQSIKQHKIAFAEINPPENLVFWQNKPQALFKIIQRLNQKAPKNDVEDPSLIFWQLLVLNTSLAISDLGTGFYLFILAIFAVFWKNSWLGGWAKTLFGISFLSSFFGILFGSIWTDFWQKQNFYSQFFQNFQIINFWDAGSKAPLNQLLALNSSFRLVLAFCCFFLLVIFIQLFWAFWRGFKQKRLEKKVFSNFTGLGFYVLLPFIFSGQIVSNLYLHSKISNIVIWFLLQPLVSIVIFLTAFGTSLQINKFLIPIFYQPKTTRLKSEKETLSRFRFISKN